MPLGYRDRRIVHGAIVGVRQQDRYARRLPTHAWEGPFKRPSLLQRIINRITQRKP